MVENCEQKQLVKSKIPIQNRSAMTIFSKLNLSEVPNIALFPDSGTLKT